MTTPDNSAAFREEANAFIRMCAKNGKLALAMSWTPELTEALAAALASARERGRREAMEEACRAVCGGCALGEPYDDESHATPGRFRAACYASPIRALMSAPMQPETGRKEGDDAR